jgi:hypothetical protein
MRSVSWQTVIGLRCPSSWINCQFMAARVGASWIVARR